MGQTFLLVLVSSRGRGQLWLTLGTQTWAAAILGHSNHVDAGVHSCTAVGHPLQELVLPNSLQAPVLGHCLLNN